MVSFWWALGRFFNFLGLFFYLENEDIEIFYRVWRGYTVVIGLYIVGVREVFGYSFFRSILEVFYIVFSRDYRFY